MYRNLNAACTTCASMVSGTFEFDTFAAGEACSSACGRGYPETGEGRLAAIRFPVQQYRRGLCPDEALEQGTLFPELVL